MSKTKNPAKKSLAMVYHKTIVYHYTVIVVKRLVYKLSVQTKTKVVPLTENSGQGFSLGLRKKKNSRYISRAPKMASIRLHN